MIHHHKGISLIRYIVGGAIAFWGGCIGQAIRPTVMISQDESVTTWNYSDWATVLGQACAGTRVDYDRLLQGPLSLERFLSRVQQVGPTSTPGLFPTPADRSAYYINCHNATIVRSVLALAKNRVIPTALPSGFEHRFRFRIDGSWQSPSDLRQRALATAGHDWRVRLALCAGRQTGPPLYRRVFVGDLLDGQLRQCVRESLMLDSVVTISHTDKKQLQIWGGLYSVRNRLILDYARQTGAQDATLLSALLDWSDATRRADLNAAVGYEVAVIPESDRINAKDLPTPVEQQSAFSRLFSFTLIQPTR